MRKVAPRLTSEQAEPLHAASKALGEVELLRSRIEPSRLEGPAFRASLERLRSDLAGGVAVASAVAALRGRRPQERRDDRERMR